MPELTYCTNVHPGERWRDVQVHLERDVPDVRTALGDAGPFAVGLRLSARAALELASDGERQRLRDLLRANALYVVTLNGFPYGAFSGARVKHQVFEPDWRTAARLDYTNQLADLLDDVLPERASGSISTLPGASRAARRDASAAPRIAAQMLEHAAHLAILERRTGRTVCLAIEPEPFAFLETTEEAIAFFEEHLFARAAIDRLAAQIGASRAAADETLHRVLGVCLDACHMAVTWEDPRASVRRAHSAGVRIAKLQVSAAVEVDLEHDGADALDALEQFDEGVYLHQVFGSDGRRWIDLGEAIAEARAQRTLHGRWRVHFHVPVFGAPLAPLRTTQSCLREAIAAYAQTDRPCLEVETYTWNVLPVSCREETLACSIAREIEWTRRCLRP